MTDKTAPTGTKPGTRQTKAERKVKLASALRDNLKRRKAAPRPQQPKAKPQPQED